MQVQNKLQAATPLLPAEVQQQGLRVTKPTRNFLVVLGFYSTDNSLSGDDLSNFVASNVQDPISRTSGVGDVQLFGAQFAMRIWLDPAKLAGVQGHHERCDRGHQGAERAGVGGTDRWPAGRGRPDAERHHRRPHAAHQARGIPQHLLRVNADGSRLHLGDVARVNLDAENFVRDVKFNGRQATAMGDPPGHRRECTGYA